MSFYGAKWWKVDFHVHTPASAKCYNQDELTISPKDLLLNAMAKKIDCLVISDHETCEWIEPLRLAYEELRQANPLDAGFRELFIFPAFEYGESAPSAHMLCIFDIDTSVADVQKAMGELREKTFSNCIHIVSERGGIAIPAHVENTNKGLFEKLNNDGNLVNSLVTNYIQGELFSIECEDISTPLPQIFLNNKIRLSRIIGSDSHSLATIGEKFTWIKMQQPNITALRLALFDSEDGAIRYDDVSGDPNTLDNFRYIKSISIENAQKAGNGHELQVNFSPWLNTIIGGRGSGKSAIINFLRIGLLQTDGMDESTKKEFDNFNKISSGRGTVSGMLKDSPAPTQITTEICENGVEYRLIYKYGHGVSEEILSSDGTWELLSEEKMENFNHPIAIFNQKQVYNMAISQDSVMINIDKMCDVTSMEQSVSQSIDAYISLCREIRELDSKIIKEAEFSRELIINQTKLEAAKNSSINDLLSKLKTATEFNGKIADVESNLTKRQDSLIAVKSELSNIDFTYALNDNQTTDEYQQTISQIQEFAVSYNGLINKVIDNINEVITKTESWSSISSQLPFVELFNQIKSKFETETAKLEEQGIQMDNMEQVLQSNEEVKIELAKIDEIKKQKDELLLRKQKMYEDITNTLMDINSVRKAKISELNSNNDFLRIELIEYGNAEDSEPSLRNAINKNDSTFKEQIYTDSESSDRLGILNKICSQLNTEKRLEQRNEFINNIIRLCNDNIDFEFDGKFKTHCKRIFETDKDLFEKLVFWYPKNQLKLTLLTDGTETPVSSGSAGQRVAGMLAFLLAINDKPIIIDQPEEDLDTKLISSFVVEKFKQLKRTQQLIIVTHNPNIPVNAAAENIISMSFSGGQIINKSSGALQLEDVRKDICSIMEGGKKALDNRYFRVSKALKNE